MNIKYAFQDGAMTEVEVSDEIGAVIIDLDRQEYNINHKETRRHCSLDYRRALRRQKKFPEDKDVKTRRLECERFFRSGWFEELTSLDGEVLLDKLYQEVYSE